MLSEDLREQLEELTPFSEAIRYLQEEQNGSVVKVPHSNPSKRAKDELRKMQQDLHDLTLLAKRLDDPKKHNNLFSDDSILSFIDAVLDISENVRRTAELIRKEQQIIGEFHARWMKEAQEPFEKKKISEKEHELKRKEIFDARDIHLKTINEAFKLERVPDPRRTKLAARIAAMCLDYCSSQLMLAEQDRVNVDLYQKVLNHAKELIDSIAGKVQSFHPPSTGKDRRDKPEVLAPAAPGGRPKKSESKNPRN
ncbi:MAG: hypothetical protein ACREBU_16230 [Nitrososphaera sp.]